MLKKINFFLSSFLPHKLYWYLAGLVHPWEAVVEDAGDPTKLYRQGKDMVRLLEKLKLVDKNYLVLDIGCGVGRLEYALVKKVQKCVGIDISSSMVNLAKKYIKAENAEFLVTNGTDLRAVYRQKFDLVFSILVFQHIPRDVFMKYLRESNLVLKPGGRLFFQIPIFWNQKPAEPPKNHPWALRYYKLDQLKKSMERLKFTKIKFFNVSGNELSGNEDQAFIMAVKK